MVQAANIIWKSSGNIKIKSRATARPSSTKPLLHRYLHITRFGILKVTPPFVRIQLALSPGGQAAAEILGEAAVEAHFTGESGLARAEVGLADVEDGAQCAGGISQTGEDYKVPLVLRQAGIFREQSAEKPRVHGIYQGARITVGVDAADEVAGDVHGSVKKVSGIALMDVVDVGSMDFLASSSWIFSSRRLLLSAV